MTKVPRECPKCHSKRIHTETAQEITREFYDGKLCIRSSLACPIRTFCDKCYYEFPQKDDSKRKKRIKRLSKE